MRAPFAVRAARASDAGQLTTLARLSKAHWGYPREWLDLWEADLTITPETIDDSIGYVAEYEGWIVGFWIRAAMNCDRPTPGWLFVDPDHMGQGIGRALWAAVRQEAAARGIASFVIEADPMRQRSICRSVRRGSGRRNRPLSRAGFSRFCGLWFERRTNARIKNQKGTVVPNRRIFFAFSIAQMQKPPPDRAGVSGLGSLTITYFHTGIRTIIGVESFHGPVRDGKEWDRLAMVIRQRGLLRRFAAQPIGKKQ
ncbi:hypothetical protein FEP17_05672 [Burkholderia multivorans]|nr:hypothetical protein [Burkholderia multivorans]MDR9299805.1 hypothetical protein [Burkholderia multivorans]